MDLAWIMGRIQRLLMSPATEWDAIAGEAADVQKIYQTYVGPLVIAAALAAFIGQIVFLGFPITAAITGLVLGVVFGLIMVYVVAFVINALAPQFGATPDMGQAFKLAAYSPTASWVAGLIMIIPQLGILAILGGLYSLYLLYVGLPKLMKPAQDKTIIYILAIIGVMIVIYIVIGAIVGSIVASMMVTGAMMNRY